MSKRYLVLGLSVVLALALAVPAFGGPSNPIASISASAKKIAQKALKKANAAQSTANTANATANTALTEAKKALTNAATAQSAADAAKAAATAANTNANSRLKEAHEVFGTATASNTEIEKSTSVSCPSSEENIGGGYAVGGAGSNSVTVTNEEQTFYGTGWFVVARAITGTPTWSLTAIAMCGQR